MSTRQDDSSESKTFALFCFVLFCFLFFFEFLVTKSFFWRGKKKKNYSWKKKILALGFDSE